MNSEEKYTRFGNYYLAMMRIPDRARRAEFGLAIDEFMFDGVAPEWKPNSDEEFLWQMILPSMKTSKRQHFNGLKSKGKGKGPRPSMQGNQNARKQRTNEIAQDSLTPEEFAEMWNAIPGDYPEVSDIVGDRRENALARLCEFGNTKAEQSEKITRLFDAVKKSTFTKGWRCNFDWLVENESNWRKVLEGQFVRRNDDDIRKDVNKKDVNKMWEEKK